MISLFVDTSYKSLFIALFKDNNLIDKIQIMSEFNFSETMIPTIDKILKDNNLDVRDINKIFTVIGPGSFTGIRIGLTACKIISYTLNIPIIPLSSLEFMATTDVDTDFIIPFIDARHEKVFGGVYDRDGMPVIDDKYCCLEELTKELNGTYTYVTFDENVVKNFVIPKYNVSKIVMNHINDEGKNCHEIKPNYLKKTEAEEKLNDSRI